MMGIFDQETPVLTSSRVSAQDIITAHIESHPGYEGPELPTTDGNRYTLPDQYGRPVTWNGATTLAKELDNPYAIKAWRERMLAYGLSLRQDLAVLARSVKPDTTEGKETLRKVVNDALSSAAIEAGANEGTAWHQVFERIDRGEPIEDLPEYFHKGIRARQECLRRHGIEILPEYVERAVRCLMFEVSGKLDRIVRYEGRYVIVDDKSENDPLRYPKAKSVQFAIYANAGELFDPATFTIEAMPDVRRDLAIMLHFDKVNHTCEAYGVPIDIGWWGARLAREVRQWRKMECMIAPLVSIGSWVPKELTEVEQHVVGNGSAPSEDVVEANVETIVSALAQLDDPQDNTDPQQLIATIKDAQEKVTEIVKEDQPSAKSSWQTSDVSGQPISNPGIDPMTEAEELIARYATKPGKKKELWQGLCRSVGITDLNRHIVGRNGLALAYVNKRNELGMTETQAEVMRAAGDRVEPKQDHYGRNLDGSPSDAPYEGSEQQLRDADLVATVRAELNQLQLLTHDEVLDEIEKAQSKQDLADIWKRFTDEYGEAAWTGQLAKAGMDRLRVIENQRPVASDNPFA